MRLLLITLIALTIILTASAVTANVVSEPLRVNTIRVPDQVSPGEYFPVYVNYEAEDEELENVKVRAIVMDSGYYMSDKTDSLTGREASRFDLMAQPDAEGWVLVRVTVSNDDIKRVKHRWIKVR